MIRIKTVLVFIILQVLIFSPPGISFAGDPPETPHTKEIKKLKNQKEYLRQRVYTLLNEKGILERDLYILKTKISEIERSSKKHIKRIEGLSIQKEYLIDQISAIRDEKAALNQRFEDLKNILKDRQFDIHEELRDAKAPLQKKIKSLNVELKQLKIQLKDNENLMSDLKSDKQRIQKTIQQFKDAKKNLDNQLRSSRESLQEAEEQFKQRVKVTSKFHQNEINVLEVQINGYRSELGKFEEIYEDKIRFLNHEVGEANRLIEREKTRISHYKKENTRLINEFAEVNMQRSGLNAQVKSLEGQLKSKKKEMDEKVKNMREIYQYELMKPKSKKTKRKGQSKRDDGYRDLYQEARQLKRRNKRLTEKIDWLKKTCGKDHQCPGSVSNQGSQPHDKEIKKLRKQLKESDKSLDATKNRLQSSRKKHAILKKDNKILNREIRKYQNEDRVEQLKIRNLEMIVKKREDRAEQLRIKNLEMNVKEEEVTLLKAANVRLNEQVIGLNRKIIKHDKNINLGITKAIKPLKKKNVRLHKDIERLNQLNRYQKDEVNILKNDRVQITQLNNGLQKDLNQITKKYQSLNASIKRREERKESTRVKTLADEIMILNSKNTRLDDQIVQLHLKLSDKNNEIASKVNLTKKLLVNKNMDQRKGRAERLKIRNLENTTKELRKQLKDTDKSLDVIKNRLQFSRKEHAVIKEDNQPLTASLPLL